MAVPAEQDENAFLKNRDRSAWARTYDRYVTDIYAFIAHLVHGDRSLAEELHQETWLAALAAITQYDPNRGELRSWLFAIARNQVALHYRRRSVRRETEAFPENGFASNFFADDPQIPHDLSEQIERDAAVRAALIELQPDWREAIVHRYVHGLSVNDIAERIGRSPKAVESLLSRARARLRRLLRWYFPNVTQEHEVRP